MVIVFVVIERSEVDISKVEESCLVVVGKV